MTVTDTRPLPLEARLAAYEPGIDLIVVSYRSSADLHRFVDSVPGQLDWIGATNVDVRIVLVDPLKDDLDGATADVSRLVIAEAGRVTAKVIAHPENVGFNVACNQAGAEGDRSVIVCCNADVAFDDSSAVLATLHDRLLRHEDWGAAGPRQLDGRGRFTGAGIFGTQRRPAHRAWHAQDRGQCSDLRTDAVVVAGSCIAMRRDVWDQLTACGQVAALTGDAAGPLLETKHWWGETWACYHAAAHGYDLVYDGTVWCRHDHASAPDSATWGRANQRDDVRLFRAACDAHGIPRD